MLKRKINQIKQLKAAGYLDTKDQDKINKLYACTLKKGEKKSNIPPDGGHFLSTEIDTTKIRKSKA